MAARVELDERGQVSVMSLEPTREAASEAVP